MNTLNSLNTFVQLVSYLIFVYFLGLIISRVGSFLEIFFKSDKENCSKFFIKYSSYKDYIKAEKEDSKITILSLQANLYRSLFGLFVLILILYLTEKYFPQKNISGLLVLLLFLIIFYFSWRKQVGFVRRRVNNTLKNN
jgi:prolipoprotein diacylglyceryltransferase